MAAQETTNPRLEALVASLKDSQDKTTSAVISSDASVQSLNSQIDSIGKSIVSEIGTSISALQSAIGNIKIPAAQVSTEVTGFDPIISSLNDIKSHLFGIEGWAQHSVINLKEIKEAIQTPLIQEPAQIVLPTTAADTSGPEVIIPPSPDDSVDPLLKVSENTSETVKLVKQLIKVTKSGDKAGKKRNFLFRAIGGTLKKSFGLGMKAFRFTKESARERIRALMGAGEAPGEAEDEEPKAKKTGFFSKIAGAMMSPFKGLKKIGKGVQGFMEGLAKGLLAFANPMILVGVGVLALSLPILAAGLAAAFKVFDMIMGEGKAMEMITGIIESLGRAVGIALALILEGIGKMISAAGPGIKLFFEGLAIVIEALQPIIKDVLDAITAIVTNPVVNQTIQKVIGAIETAITSIKEAVIAFAAPVETAINAVKEVILAIVSVINNVVTTIGGVIEKILSSFDNVVNQIKPIIEQIGVTIETIINAIGDNVAKIGTSIEGVFNAIGDNVSKVINSIGALIKTIGDTVVNVIDGVVGGIERLAALPAGSMVATAGALVVLAAALASFAVGAAVAGGVMPSRETIEGLAATIERFGLIPTTNLIAVGAGMKAVGDGMAAFGKGGAIASGSDFFTSDGTFDNIAKQLVMFGKIEGGNLVTVGTGMKAVGDGLGAFGKGSAIAAASNLFIGDGSMFGSIATNVKRFGDLNGQNLVAVGTGIEALGKGLAAWGGGSAISAVGSAISGLFQDDPTEDFKKFAEIGAPLKDAADGIMGLAAAFSLFSDADPAQAAAALNTFGKNVNVATLNKIRGAMASGAEGMLVPAGAVTPAILHGGAGGEVVAPLPDLSRMVVQAGATGAALIAGRVEGDELRAQQAKSTAIDASTQTQIVNNNQPMTMVALPAEPKNTEVLPVG